MDSKKRPNEDEHGADGQIGTTSENVELIKTMPDTAMEVDGPKDGAVPTLSSPASGTAATMIAETMIPGAEANKRLKLTKEADNVGSDYSPSADLADPSQESKGLAEWVGKMDQMDQDDVPKAVDPSQQPLDSVSENNKDTVAKAGETGEADATPMQTDEPSEKTHDAEAAGQDLVQALLAPESAPDAASLSDSVLAVASLSEPMVTTLEMLEEIDTSSRVTKEHVPTAEPSTANSEVSVPTDSHGDAAEIPASTGVEDQLGDSAKVTEAVTVIENTPEIGSFPQSTTSVPAVEAKEDILVSAAPSEEPVPETADVTMDSVDNTPKVADSNTTVDTEIPTMQPPVESIMDTKVVDSTSTPAPAPPVIDSTEKPQSSAAEDKENDAHEEPLATPVLSESSRKTSPPPTLPPLSVVTKGHQTSTTSHSTPRSTMSLSTLLIDNEDEAGDQDTEQRQEVSSNIFDRFNSTPHSPPVQTTGIAAPTSQIAPPKPTVPVTPASNAGPGAYRSTSGHSAGSYQRDTYDHSAQDGRSINDRHSSFGRSFPDPLQSPVHSQEAAAIRNGSAKEFPADEVMESGGVSGYAPSRHRLASPLGMRPLPEPIHGLSISSKERLPGVGSVASPTSHHHPSEAIHRRQDHNLHGRQDSSSHSSMTENTSFASGHQSTLNGALNYPTGSPSSTMSHISVAPVSLPSLNGSDRKPPRLIVRNDSSLKMEGRQENFLGYFRYDPAQLLPDMQGKENSLLEVRVASSYLTYDNFKVQKRELWGTDVYTDDSDIVAMLIHSGQYIPTVEPQNPDSDITDATGQRHNFVADPIKHICPSYDLSVTLRVLPKLVRYQGSIRHRIKSRTWNTGHDGVSFRIESTKKLSVGEALNRGRSQSKRRIKENDVERQRVLTNVQDDSTESLQNERAMRTATFEFTRQGDPCFKYTPELVMDRDDGMSHKWTSWRFKKEVLILENDEERYEISLQHPSGTGSRVFDQYRFAVISPRTSLSSWSKAGYPLGTSDLIEVLYEDLDWQDFEWVERGVVVQPTLRSKQTRQSAAVEGGPHLQDTAMEGVEAPASTEGENPQTNPVGSNGNGTVLSVEDEARQDGVFCVVSRLFWRSLSEKDIGGSGATQPANTAASHPGHSTTDQRPVADPAPTTPAASSATKTVKSTPSTEATHATQDGPISSTPATTAVRPPTSVNSHSSSTAPSAPTATTATIATTVAGATAATTTPVEVNTAPPPLPAVSLPLTEEAKEVASPAVPMDVDTNVTSTPKATLESSGHVSEREEGELEEGEIASD